MVEHDKQKREAPVSFRPGKLRAAIRHRAVRSLTEGQIVKRDLGRYYLLLGQVVGDVHLTRKEAIWLAAATFGLDIERTLSGDPFIPEHENPSDFLMQVVKYGVRTRQGDVAERVAAKVDAMSSLQRAAVVDALDRLPAESEEDIYDTGNWSLIGIPLEEDPVDGGMDTQRHAKEVMSLRRKKNARNSERPAG